MRRACGSGTDEQNRREGCEGAFASALTQRLLHTPAVVHCSLFRVQSPSYPSLAGMMFMALCGTLSSWPAFRTDIPIGAVHISTIKEDSVAITHG